MIKTDKIVAAFEEVAHAKGWHRHHTPKNLAAAVSVEAGELLAEFQWLSDCAAAKPTPEFKSTVGAEVADIVMYLTLLCDKLDIDINAAMEDKIAANRQRFLECDNE